MHDGSIFTGPRGGAGAVHFRVPGFYEGSWFLSARIRRFTLRFLLRGCLRVPAAAESDDGGGGGGGVVLPPPVGWWVDYCNLFAV